jgi:hypothetical protein
MATMQLTSGDRYASDFVPIDQRGDNYGNEGVQQFNGKYAELVRRGVVFLYSTAAAGIALIVSATTGGHPTLWNPLGSGKIFYPLVLLCITKGTGAQIGTASPIPTFTAVAAEQAAAGGPNTSSRMVWSPATNTFTVAPAFWATTGLNMAGTAPINSQEVDFDGGLALYPGTAMSVTYSVATSTSLHHVTIWGAELPIV